MSGAGIRLAAAGVVVSACVAWWATAGPLVTRVDVLLATFGLVFAASLVAGHAAQGLPPAALRAALLLALAWRAVLVAAPPLLSDDVYRYVWEGRIQLHGGNPYEWQHRPEAARWTPLRDEVWSRTSHKFYTALYPPLWQLAARAVVAVHDSVAAMKAFAVLCELGALALLAFVLKRRGIPRGRLLLWAWSPLALLEIAGSGHNDAMAILALCGSLAALEARRPMLAALCAALGAQVKAVPALVAAVWVRRFRMIHVAAAVLAALALFVPFAAAGEGLWHSLVRYGRFWRFNESLFAVVRTGLGGDEDRAAMACAVLLAATAAWIAFRVDDPAEAGLAVVAAALLLGGNVLPWYALWLLPFALVTGNPGALLFTGTVALAYLVYPDWLSGERWQVRPWVRVLEYAPCLVVAAIHHRQTSRVTADAPLAA